MCVLLRRFASFLGLDKRFSVCGQQLFVVPVTFHHILRLAPTSGGSSRFLANSAAQRPTLRSNAARLTKKRFEKWREKRVPSFQENRLEGDGCVKDLLHLLRKKKGSRTTELVLWLLREFNRAADKLADWVLLARKIRQFVKHRWDAQRQAPGSASAMLAQHRAPSFFVHRERLHQTKFSAYGLNKLIVMFMPCVPGKTHLPSPVDPSSCYQQIFPSVYHPHPSASHPEIPVVIMCP